jgi:hypothetical protein
MYEYILQNKIATSLAAIAVAWLAGVLVGNSRILVRSIAFNYGPSFACAFFVIGFSYDGQFSDFDMAAGLIFEFSALLFYTKLLCDTVKSRRGINALELEKWLRWSLALLLLVALPIVTSEGFGIFSEGSRISYLEGSGAAKYFTYAAVLISSIQAGLVALRLSTGRSLGLTGYATIVVTFGISTLSGSKGSFFLWLASILALIDYRNLRVRWKPILGGLIVVGATLVVTGNFVADTLGISATEFVELALSRFFLNNDARALAFDFGGKSGQLSVLASESFRSISAAFGHGPNDPPLGILLYEQHFGVSSGNGANASLMALITYYSQQGFALIPALIACLGLAALYGGVVALRRAVHGPLRKMAVSLMGLILVQQLSQDFLAFQILVPLACTAWFFFIVTHRKHAGALSRRLRPSARPTISQHRHSGT